MLKKIAFAIAGTVGLAFALLAPVPSGAASVNGAYAPNVETSVADARYYCVRKWNGHVKCGYFDRDYGYYRDRDDYYERPRGYYGYYGRGW